MREGLKTVASARGVCPNCRRNLPGSKMLSGLGKVFECRGCEVTLYIPKAHIASTLPILAGLIALSEIFAFWWVMLAAIFAGYIDWMFLPVRQVEMTSS